MKQVWSIQYLRAVAALGVVAFHALESTPYAFGVGAAGVDLFFVISGFIMASLMLDDGATPGQFLSRRIARIVPLYWLTTAAALAIAIIKPDFFYRMDPSLENAALSFTFIPHQSQTGGVAPVLWQGWTLEYEMFFYLLCAAVLTLAPPHRLKYLGALLIALVATGLALKPSSPILSAYTNPLLLEFAAGMALAGAWRVGAVPKPGLGAVLLTFGFALYGAQQAGLIAVTGARVIDWGVPAVLILAGALGLEAAGRVAHWKAGLMLGDASYALYLTHGFVVSAFIWFFADASLWIRVPACLAGAIAAAIATYIWLERPLTNTLKQALRPKPV